MCGIVGAVAQRDVAPILLEGLKRLEYRGYDSAGMSVFDGGDKMLNRLRCLGKVSELEAALQKSPMSGGLGIAHTRWATHGEPSEHNAHPHISGTDIAVVHNGIIENYESLRAMLSDKGYEFTSETDSETIAHLIQDTLKDTDDLLLAVKKAVQKLEGAYAIAVIDQRQPDKLVIAREGSPLVVGLGIGENFVASDQLALLPVTQKFLYLEEGDIAEVKRMSIRIFDRDDQEVERDIHESELNVDVAEKGEFRHFMLKEIYEQPRALADTLESRLSGGKLLEYCFGADAEKIFDQVKQVQIVACGTSYHAGLVAKYWLESIAEISCQVEIASEIRYRKHQTPKDTLFVSISQSGETADTLAALRQAKTNDNYVGTLAICNVPASSLVRESDLVLMTRAGAEIGVASTKAFTTQLVSLMLLVIALGRRHGLTEDAEAKLVSDLQSLPKAMKGVLKLDAAIQTWAEQFVEKNHALFLGRGVQYPIAMEGALKLKEISYIHAEAYPAGELKHGPLALVDDEMPVISVAPNNELLEKLKSNLEEVRARGGKLFVFADAHAEMFEGDDISVMPLEQLSDAMAPIMMTIPLQLLSYHVAVLKGTDVDQPRNLAKSVTVE